MSSEDRKWRPGAADPSSARAAKTTWRERLRETANVAANLRRTLAMVAQVDRGLLVALVALGVADAALAVAVAYVGKRIVDAVVAAAAHAPGASARVAVAWVALELAVVAARAVASQASTHAQLVLRSRLGLHVNTVILAKAANVSYPRFEDPAFMNAMTQARREASSRPLDAVNQSLAVLRNAATLAGYGALLWSLGPWALAALVLTAVPSFVVEARYGRQAFTMQRGRTGRNRVLFYLEQVLTTEQTAKEVKLFALASWLVGRYREVHEGFHEEEVALSRRRTRDAAVFAVVAALALYGAYAVVAARAAVGAITLGSMTLYVVVLREGQARLQGVLSAVARLYENNLYMTNLYEFLAVPDDEPDEPIDPAERPGDAPPPRVEFKNVSYRYPGSAREALADVSLVLEPGETVALVGRNGAGKTTLVKLLTGLYRPTSGVILIDGVDASTMSAPELRRRVGVIFQDFARFQFSAGENVGVGWLPMRESRPAIESAVHDAGADEVIARLPAGLDTPLGRAFGGDDLSVGQWQRIALARAFMRRSKILVLDEPTASLDAEAEHEIFQRFRDLKAGRTALLITHRFATVRMADKIVVFEGGRIVESGSHAALMAEGGRYASMFRLQAQGYELDPPQPEGDGGEGTRADA